MAGGVSDAREEITMTASRSGTTVISCHLRLVPRWGLETS
jgi:hypothetical protein